MASLRTNPASLLALIVAACSSPGEPPPLPTHSPGIAMESRFGGSLNEAFTLDANGNGAWRQAQVGTGPSPYDIVTKRFHGGPEGFARLKARVEQLDRQITAQSPGCRSAAGADPVWTIRWAWGNSLVAMNFRYGCRDDEEQRETFAMIVDIEDEVCAWAEPMPIAERYPVATAR